MTTELVREPGLASHTLWPGHPLSGSLQAQLALTGPSEALMIALGTLPTRGVGILAWAPAHPATRPLVGVSFSALILSVAWSHGLGPTD